MVTVYFITALVMLNVQPTTGWVQHTFPYKDKELCERFIKINKENIFLEMKYYFKSKFITIQKFKCMTYNEAVKRNTELGH